MNFKEPTLSQTDDRDLKGSYQRAQMLLQGLRTQNLVQNDNLQPRWIDKTDCFWYPRFTKDKSVPSIKTEYRLVDAVTLTNKPAFDHCALTQALAKATEREVNAQNLPISAIVISLSPSTVTFTAFDQRWQFDCNSQTCTAVKFDIAATIAMGETLSPDGKQIAFARDNNLWVRDVSSGEERALTHDGEMFNCYGAPPSAGGVPGSMDLSAQWSPDSQRLFTLQRDTRQVKTYPTVNHVPQEGQIRPTVKHIKLAFPGDDDLEQYRLLTIEVATAKHCEVSYSRLVVGADDFGFFTMSRRAWWAHDSRHAYFIEYQGSYQCLRLIEVDTDTGITRILFEETSNTYVNLQPEYMDLPLHRYLPETNELIWWSERSDWGHLYLYDLETGELKHPITSGDWRVRNVLHVDTSRRELVIQTAAREPNRNPYYRDICRVHIDTRELSTLLSTDHEYGVNILAGNEIQMGSVIDADEQINGISPSTDYVVATRSRADQVPVSLLLNRDGKTLLELETADISNLPDGWQWPEPVKMTAADNKTDIYGVLFRPSDFSENSQYPVINMIVGGPWLSAVPYGSFHNSRGYIDRYYFQGAALAELGFMVVVIDSRGTPSRNKAFQDTSYGWVPSGANTDDHRGGIEQLASRYPSMDLNRVGIYSPSGYYGGIQNLFECPDFYRAGVIFNCMDTRLVSRTSEHIDKYQGVGGPANDKCYPEQLAEQWDGKLLLIQSMYGTPGYPPAGTFRLVEALQNANKDVDQLVVPQTDFLMGSYEQRRAWDYLVKHLQGAEPPKEFNLGEFSH